MRAPESLFARRLGLIALGALVLRVVYVVGAKRGEGLLGDQIFYSGAAEAFADGRWFDHPYVGGPAADHPPLTAIVLGPVSLLPGDSLFAQRLFMTLVGTAVVIAIGYLARTVTGDRAGLVAAAVAAVYPGLWMNDGLVMSESLGALTVAAVLLATYRYLRAPDGWWACTLGATCGLAVLARPESGLLFVLIALPAVLVARGPGAADRLRHLVGVGVAGLLVLAPWVGPNLVRFERPVLLSTNDGLTLLGANCPAVYSEEGIGLWSLECAEGIDGQGLDQSEVSAAYREQAIENITENADRLPAVVAARVGRVWSAFRPADMIGYNEGEGRERWASWAGLVGYYVLVPFAVGGAVVVHRRRSAPVWPLLAPFVLVTVTAALFYGLTRFRIPAEVSLVVLAGTGVDALLPRAGAPPGRTPGAAPHAPEPEPVP